MITVIILASILSVLTVATVAAWYGIGTLQEKMWSKESK